jgi:hypothetical protein
MGFWETTNSVSKHAAKVNRFAQIPGLEIALHSPAALVETGLRMCLLEKNQDSTAFDAEQCVLCGPVCF